MMWVCVVHAGVCQCQQHHCMGDKTVQYDYQENHQQIL